MPINSKAHTKISSILKVTNCRYTFTKKQIVWILLQLSKYLMLFSLFLANKSISKSYFTGKFYPRLNKEIIETLYYLLKK